MTGLARNQTTHPGGLLRGAQSRESEGRLEALLIDGLESGKHFPLTGKFWSGLKTDTLRSAAALTSMSRGIVFCLRPP